MTPAWHELQTRGFVVVPGFLPPDECDALADELHRLTDDARARHTPNYNSRRLSPESEARLAPRMLEAARQVASCTETDVDLVRSGQFYASELGVDFGWHNDHDAYFRTQDFINYLNFWIAIRKPDRHRSGISVVPHDALRARHPELAEWMIGRGAIVARRKDGRTHLHDSDRVENRVMEGEDALDALAVTPEVGGGDLILMRGDLLHRTQDLQTPRIALSYRLVSSRSVIRRDQLMHMGFNKFNIMAGNKMEFARRFAAFEIAGRAELTVAQSEAICEELDRRIAGACRELQIQAPNHEQFRSIVLDLAAEYQARRQG